MDKNKMMVVTGTGRSGTSVLIMFLKNMGYKVQGKWDNSLKAGLEGEITNINSRMANKIYKQDKTIIQDIDKLFDEVKVTKDPTMFAKPKVLDEWYKAKPDADFKFIICLRNGKETMDSMIKTGMFQHFNLKDKEPNIFESQIGAYLYQFIKRCVKYNWEYEIVWYPDYLKDYERAYTIFKKVGLDFDYKKGEEEWKKLMLL